MSRHFEVRPQVAKEAIAAALAYRERTRGPWLTPTRVTVFCLPIENEIGKELVLKVHGTGSVLRIVAVPKRERMGGLFEEDREAEQVREIGIGEDWCLVYERDLPDWAVAQTIRDAETERRPVYA